MFSREELSRLYRRFIPPELRSNYEGDRQGMAEGEILNAFINSGILRGWFVREVPVGLERIKRITRSRGYSEEDTRIVLGTFSRKIDMICVEGVEKAPMKFPGFKYLDRFIDEIRHKGVWLLEAKRNLSAEVIGQILVDKYHFSRDYPDVQVRGIGIVCGEVDYLLDPVCKSLGIRVFEIG